MYDSGCWLEVGMCCSSTLFIMLRSRGAESAQLQHQHGTAGPTRTTSRRHTHIDLSSLPSARDLELQRYPKRVASALRALETQRRYGVAPPPRPRPAPHPAAPTARHTSEAHTDRSRSPRWLRRAARRAAAQVAARVRQDLRAAGGWCACL